MFLLTSIAMLRERTTGTLERLMTLPMGKLDLLGGYAIAFGLLAALQAVVVCLVGFLALGLDAAHGAWLVGLLAIGNALLGMALGLFVSAFARTEFQAVQFMPAFIFPQLLLCGLFIARSEMAELLYWLSWALPLTYAYDALVTRNGSGSARRALRARRHRRRGVDDRRTRPRSGHPPAPDRLVGVVRDEEAVRVVAGADARQAVGHLGWERGAQAVLTLGEGEQGQRARTSTGRDVRSRRPASRGSPSRPPG